MDLFYFLNPNSPTRFEQGVMIKDLTSAIWIERYRDFCEFTLKARIDSNLRTILTNGTFISHIDTNEIMIVENQEINNSRELSSEITFTGRSFETFLENRVVGAVRTFPRQYVQPAYALWNGPIGEQAVSLIEDHILPEKVLDPKDALPYISVLSTAPLMNNVATNFERKELYPQLLDLLSKKNLGIKTIRPNALSPLGSGHPNALFVIHRGVDLSNTVIFSNDLENIKTADYFWSNRKIKNCAMVTSTWFEIMVKSIDAGYNRRVMYVDAKELDEMFEELPVGASESNILNSMADIGEAALENQKEIVIRNVSTTKPFGQYKYGIDFNVGDIVGISGDYNERTKMRVIEYVRIQDETGRSEYPVLSAI